jgi:hypothetical protein
MTRTITDTQPGTAEPPAMSETLPGSTSPWREGPPRGEGTEATVRTLAKQLAGSIANLGYPVGMGVAPPEEACMKAARGILDLYPAHPAGGEAPSVVVALAGWLFERINGKVPPPKCIDADERQLVLAKEAGRREGLKEALGWLEDNALATLQAAGDQGSLREQEARSVPTGDAGYSSSRLKAAALAAMEHLANAEPEGWFKTQQLEALAAAKSGEMDDHWPKSEAAIRVFLDCLATPTEQAETPVVGDTLAAIRTAVLTLCNGHPAAKIAWPHRELHAIADRLAALNEGASQ